MLGHVSDTCHTLPLLPPLSRQPQKKSHGGGRRQEEVFVFLFSFFFRHLVLVVWSPYKSLSLVLSVSHSLTGSFFFLHTWIPVGVCNSKHSLGKMLVATPSPHGLTGPIPPALRPGEQSHMTSNILICGLGCILSNKKPFFVVDLLFCSTLFTKPTNIFHFFTLLINNSLLQFVLWCSHGRVSV